MSTAGDKKKLPIGIQTFRKMREDGYYYVDKTEIAVRLAGQAGYYFLSRPRRFGKSLFLDTLKDLFEAQRELFDGLYAADHWDWSVAYPVIRVSFSSGHLKTAEDLQQVIERNLRLHEERWDLTAGSHNIRGRFEDLIKAASGKFGQKVVLLVDEYDKPILDNIDDQPVATAMRDGLRDFYSVIKAADPYLRFVFLTGVSKFSKVSLFSGLNNLRDITLVKEYSAICGYTEEDVDTVFAPELPGLDRDKIRDWYNGYNWTGEAVYNPFDLLLLFQERVFKAHWYETGTPAFLMKVLNQRGVMVPNLDGLMVDSDLLSTFDVGNIPLESLMFQAGYLTIKEVVEEGDLRFFRMGYPNREVYQSFNNSVLADCRHQMGDTANYQFKMLRLLKARDLDGAGRLMRGFFESIPHQWHTNNDIARYEGYYASVFYAFFASLGLDIRVEESSNAGRLDMAVRFHGRVLIFEFKVVDDAKEAPAAAAGDGTGNGNTAPAGNSALAAIAERGYAERWRAEGIPVDCIGVEFHRTQRRIVAWDVVQG